MRAKLLILSGLLLLCGAGRGGSAPPAPVSFSRQILPLLQSECFGCHGAMNPSSGYSMGNREALLKGGRHGAAILIGKGSQSSIVRYLTGENKPKMPPGIAWDRERIALVRRWIDEGAKVDSYIPAALKTARRDSSKKPMETFKAQMPAPVTALCYSPKGDLLAVSGYRAVRLFDANSGNLIEVIPGAVSQVMALAWSSDGNLLAVGGGEEGSSGEVLIVDTTTRRTLRRLQDHSEVVQTLAWKPNSHELVSGGLDKTVRVWDADRGVCTKTLKDHADYINCVAFSMDGKRFASAGQDRTVKVYEAQSYKRLFSLNAHSDGVTCVAFHPNGKLLATASWDRALKIWTINSSGMENPDRTIQEGEAIGACHFSPSGDRLVYGTFSVNGGFSGRVKVYNGEGSQQQRELLKGEDWILCTGVSPDGQRVVAGAMDGQLYFWSVNDGKLLRQTTLPLHTYTIKAPK